MADKILHKRSLTPGNAPTTSSLDLGELAINVNDGKLYLRQSGSTAHQIVNVGESASFAATASFVETAQTASYVLQAVSSSFATTAQNANTASYVVTAQTASYVQTAQTASYVLNAVSSSFATSSSFALTASYALTSAGGTGTTFPYTGSAIISGSLIVTGSIYTNSTIYSPFIIGLNFETNTPYTFNAPYSFYISSSESNPSGSITIKYQASGSATTSSYVYGNTINKFDSLIITPPAISLVILNSVKI